MISFFPSRTIALEIFGFGIHWYGIMYMLSFLLALWLLPRLQKERNLYLTNEEWVSLISWGVLGVLAGGRLGYVLFYEPAYFIRHPLDIFAVWQGGMSSHGGFIGVAICLYYYCKKTGMDLWKLGDVVVIPVALGLALGRVGNFINQELYGTVTTLPWGIIVPGVEGLRHPTQLYAVLKDVLIAGICFAHLHFVRPVKTGRTGALFLMLYGMGRFIVEYFREQTYPLMSIGFIGLTRGQLFTIPLFLIGLYLWFRLKNHSTEKTAS